MKSSKNQQLIEKKPIRRLVSRYIEKYQFYRFDSESWIKTVPNARLECWHILEGGFNIYDETKNKFVSAPKIGGYPATGTSLLFHVPEKIICLNIKFYLRALSIPLLQTLYPPNPFSNISNILSTNGLANLDLKSFYKNEELIADELDNWISPIFTGIDVDETTNEILEILDSKTVANVCELATALHCSTRTLQRLILKKFNMKPKELLSIYRFSRTANHIQSTETKRVIDSLSFGYYDQSHFIRETKKIAGVSPSVLFNNMKLQTPDLMVFNSL
ncbi:helix-turn-helix domain-containing protein [Ekhidna sp.]